MKTNKKMLELFQQAAATLVSRRLDAASPAPANVAFGRTAAPEAPSISIDSTQGQGQFIARSYSNGAGVRDYMLFIPSSYHGQPLPLIVMLHGCKQDPSDFAIGTRMNLLGEEMHCMVAYPAQAQDANSFHCWNWFNTGDQQRDQGEPSLIAGITQQVMSDYAIDSRRVYIAGLSAGGAMAVIMGRTYPDLYAAVGVHSGLAYGRAQNVYSAILAMRNGGGGTDRGKSLSDQGLSISTIVFHGDMDQTVHPDNGDQVIAHSAPVSTDSEQTADMGINIRRVNVPDGHAYTRTSYLDGTDTEVAQHWMIHGAGHGWSGGDTAGSFTDPLGPDASRAMLQFFLAHPRDDA